MTRSGLWGRDLVLIDDKGGMKGDGKGTNSFKRSNCDFLGIISSMWGERRGYVSTILERMARWTEDLTLDFAPAEMLYGKVG